MTYELLLVFGVLAITLLLPHVSPSYRALFSTDASPSPLPLRQDPLREALGRAGG